MSLFFYVAYKKPCWAETFPFDLNNAFSDATSGQSLRTSFCPVTHYMKISLKAFKLTFSKSSVQIN